MLNRVWTGDDMGFSIDDYINGEDMIITNKILIEIPQIVSDCLMHSESSHDKQNSGSRPGANTDERRACASARLSASTAGSPLFVRLLVCLFTGRTSTASGGK